MLILLTIHEKLAMKKILFDVRSNLTQLCVMSHSLELGFSFLLGHRLLDISFLCIFTMPRKNKNCFLID